MRLLENQITEQGKFGNFHSGQTVKIAIDRENSQWKNRSNSNNGERDANLTDFQLTQDSLKNRLEIGISPNHQFPEIPK